MKNMLNKSLLLLLLFSFTLWAQETEITVTGQNLALVKENRELNLKKGVQRTLLVDIPQLIISESVLIESGFSVLEQNYEYDLISVDKILQKSLEKEITIIQPDKERIKGLLISATGSNMIIRNAEGVLQIIPRNDQQQIFLNGIKEGENPFIVRPTLSWLVNAPKSAKFKTGISYLTNGLSWKADYVALLEQDEKSLKLNGWVTMNNTSGKSFKNARLKLMAGDLNLVHNQMRFKRSGEIKEMAYRMDAAPTFEEKAFFDYHLYTLQGRTDINNNQKKQIKLIPESTVKMKKIYRLDSYNPQKTAVLISFKNSKNNNLGIPLPKGRVRVYKKDGAALEFIGENDIDHTAKNATVEMEIGKAFDVRSERIVQNIERTRNRSERRKVQFKLSNEKESQIKLELIEHFQQNAEVKIHHADATLLEKRAGVLKYQVTIPAGKELKINLDYTISW